ARAKEGEADRAARREEMDADRILRRDLARTENLSRERIARMTGGKDASTFTDKNGKVFWKDTGRPVMVYEGDEAVQLEVNDVDKGSITERDLLTEVNKIRSQLDGNVAATVIIEGKQVPWRTLSER